MNHAPPQSCLSGSQGQRPWKWVGGVWDEKSPLRTSCCAAALSFCYCLLLHLPNWMPADALRSTFGNSSLKRGNMTRRELPVLSAVLKVEASFSHISCYDNIWIHLLFHYLGLLTATSLSHSVFDLRNEIKNCEENKQDATDSRTPNTPNTAFEVHKLSFEQPHRTNPRIYFIAGFFSFDSFWCYDVSIQSFTTTWQCFFLFFCTTDNIYNKLKIKNLNIY